MAGATPEERGLLAAARAGDEGAYRRLVEPHRAELHAHCYRMLGSVHDAEDALQDTLLRAWRGLARFEGRSSPRNWLYRIATNACMDVSTRRPKRVLPLDAVPGAGLGEAPGRPLAESVWIEAYPDRELGVPDGSAAPEARYELRESLELAFVAAAPAPACAPARGADPARGARVLRRRDRRAARALGAGGEQRAAACAQVDRRAVARAEPAVDASRARRRAVARARRPLHGRPRAGRCRRRARAARRGCSVVDASDVDLVHAGATGLQPSSPSMPSPSTGGTSRRRRTGSSRWAATAGSRSGIASSARSSTF